MILILPMYVAILFIIIKLIQSYSDNFLCSLFLVTFFFQNVFRFTTKLRERHRDFPYPHTCLVFSIVKNPHQNGIFVTTDELKYIVYIWVYVNCTFCGFGQMCSDMYPPLWYHTVYFLCLTISLCFSYSSLLLPNSWQPMIFFTVSIILPFPKCYAVVIITVRSLFQIGFFHLVTYVVSSMSFHGLIIHFFLMLDNIPLSGCTQFMYPFTY